MHQEEILDAMFALLKKQLANRKTGKMLRHEEHDELTELLGLDDQSATGNWSKVFFWLEQYLKYSVKTDHPGFVNRMWVGANLPSILGEMAVAFSNTSSCTFESAPVSTVMEKYMLGQMLELVGFTDGEGQMTTGSSNANMVAMLAAREEANGNTKSEGLFGSARLFGFVSEDAHYSMEKAANIIGVGTSQLLKIPVDDRGEMDTVILERRLEEVTAADGIPFFVGATAGTTVRGAYDPIEKIAALKSKYPFWLHVDAAWGGAVLVSSRLRRDYMPGIEKADSLTWDFHKMLGTALMCNVLLINNRSHTLGRVCSGGDSSYIFHDGDDNEVVDLGAVSLQCGRRVDSLKWFLDWKFFGRDGFAERVERMLDLCRYAEEVIVESNDFELVFPRNSFNICFRYTGGGGDVDQLNMAVREYLYRQGKSLVGYAYHHNRPFLRLLLASFDMTRQGVDQFFQQIRQTANTMEVELS